MRRDRQAPKHTPAGLFQPRPGFVTAPGLHSRYRRAGIAVAANAASKLLGFGVVAASIALTLPYLGAERFGVWMTILGFATLFAFMDLGAGNALVNRVAAAAARDAEELADVVTGGTAFLALVGSVIGALLLAAAAIAPWHRLLGDGPALLEQETRNAAVLFAALFGVHLFASGASRIFAGLQQAHVAHIAMGCAHVASLVLLPVAAAGQWNIPTLLAMTFGLQVLAGLALVALLARRRLLRWRGAAAALRRQWRPVLGVGGLFMLLQLGTIIGWGADPLLIAATLGPSQVAAYAVVQRLFQLVSQPLAIANAPLWQAYADADTRGDAAFLRNTLRRSMALTAGLAIAGSLLLAVTAETAVRIWTSGTLAVAPEVVALFAVWTVLECCGNALAMFLNGCGIVRAQVVTVVLFCVVTLPAKFLLLHLGLAGLLLATIGGYLLCCVLPYATAFRPAIRAKIGA
jgi:O-antigen/teichoic acid export membrane protein